MSSNAGTIALPGAGLPVKDDIYFCPDGNNAQVVTRRDFTEEKKTAIRDLQKLKGRYNWVILLHFAVWIGAAWLSITFDNIAISIVGYLIGGLSLSTLSVLGHEASHNLFTRNPKIDRWIGFLVSTPVVFSAMGYRIMHPLHHKYTREEGDPDNIENISRSPALLRVIYVFVLFLAVYLYLVMVPFNAVLRGSKREKVEVIVEWLAMIAIVAMGWVFLPTNVMLEGWLFPLIIAGQIANIRGIAEHGMTTAGNELTDSRTVATHPALSFMMCNINYHIEHHLYPGIPWYNLQKLHTMLKQEYVAAGSSVYTSYGKFLYDVGKALIAGVVPSRRIIPIHIREHVCV